MNFNNVVSLPAAGDLRGFEHSAVKLTPSGVDIAGASDRVIGTVIRGASIGNAADVFLKSEGFRYVRVGNATAIAVGDELKQDASGTFTKRVLPADSATAAAALAIEAAPINSNGGGMIRAILL